MPSLPPLWGFLGLFAGPWKLALVAAVAVAFYGRTIRRYSSAARVAANLGLAPAAPKASKPRRAWYQDRIFVFLLVVAASAVASMILGRLLIMNPDADAPPAEAATALPNSNPPPITR